MAYTSTLNMFDAQVERVPDRIAVRENGCSITYGDLDARIRAVTRGLAAKGVTHGSRVALFIPRSTDFVVTALGALRAGAVYVPVDPSSPVGRLQKILSRAEPTLVITSGSIALPSIDCATLTVAELGDYEADTPPQPYPADASKSVAYILYTSGTTGEPNGVQITERALANYLGWAARTYTTSSGYDAYWHTETTFDLSITSFLAPLVAGGTVDIVSGVDVLQTLLCRLDEASLPHVVKLTPTHARAVVDWFDREARQNPAEFVFVIGGEELFVHDAQALVRVFPNCRIYNEYGPTEATVGCCVYRWDASIVEESETVPIGTPIDNTAMYILDEHGGQAAVGTRGEIAISGPGVMLGYLGDVALTARKIVDLPWAEGPFYLTGDVGVVRNDGSFVYLGRNDTQIKLNGYRIEPAEIEAAALESVHVRQAACVVQTIGISRVLTLFVEAPDLDADVEQAISKDLERALPKYMRPGRVVARAALPVTTHNKIDRYSLAEISESDTPERSPAPADAVEETLLAVWQRVLQCETINVDDNYFAHGGDSLRSIEISALAEHRGVRFSIPMLHNNPTVRTLAQSIRAATEPVELKSSRPFYLVPAEDLRHMPDDVEDAYPLNLLQQGMIYHREFAEKSAVYHAICSYHVAMPVDVDVMREAVYGLVERHPLLRTSFNLTRFSRPLQLVHCASEPEFGYLDLRGVDPATHQQHVDEWLEEEKKRGFEIEEYPLIRFMLHQFSDDTCQLSYSFHHEIVDGWSDAVMVTELVEGYISRMTGESYQPPALQSTFRDSILLEQEAVADENYRRFWNEKMRDVVVMQLPSFVPPHADRGKREIIKFEVPVSGDLSDQLKRLARQLSAPLKTVLLAAHMKVMSLLGGVDDVLTYTVSNGRPENRDSHAVIGLFVNSLAFRMNLTGGSWAELIMNTLQTENELLSRRRYPMAELKRQHGSEPLSETLFFFNHYHVTDSLQRWADVELVGLKVYAESTFPYCVNAYLTPFDKDLRIRIEYDRLRYDKSVMDVAGHLYYAVLTAMVRDPDAGYHSESLLPDYEVARVTAPPVAAETEADNRMFVPIAARIAAVARNAPEQWAVITTSEQITYAELDARANRLAAQLIDQEGVCRGDYIGVLMGRGVPGIVATVALLKTGAVYVPFSLDQPASRLSAALEHTRGVVVCDDAAYTRFLPSAGNALRLVRYADFAPTGDSNRVVDVPVTADSPAYAMFTSGSSGRPKATVVSQGNLDSATRARIDYYGLSTDDRCVQLPSPAFDSSIGVTFGALASGATLVAPDEETMLDLPALVGFMEDAGATMTLCTPSMLDTLLSTEGFKKLPLQQVISAGEPLSPETYRHLGDLSGTTVFNEYGPTETTVWASVWRGGPCRQMPSMPIGRPIATARTYVLDDRLHPVATGVPGELYIGGEGVALGYMDAPAHTAAAYVPDPFDGKPGARMFRTGDLARLDMNGNLEFLSRIDRLVKVQGFRVEPGEIEHALARHPSVHRAVGVARDINGIKQLTAFVVRRAGAEPVSTDQLKTFCHENLPKYMVPGRFLFVDAVPLSRTGKVDYESLERTAPRSTEQGDAHAEPQTSLQAMLIEIWREALNVEQVGIHDDFTELGGESLAALRIAAKVRSTFGIDVSVRTLLASMTSIARLDDTLEEHLRVAPVEQVAEEQEIGEL